MSPSFDWTARWAYYQPDQPAAKEADTGRSLTYGELNEQAEVLARYFLERTGLIKGDRIGILAENCLEYLVLIAVAQKTGLILVPMNYRLSAPEIDYLVRDAAPSLLLIEEKFEALVTNTSLPRWPLEALQSWLAAASLDLSAPPLPDPALQPDDPIFLLYTSGTTGFPKGAQYSHGMLFWNSINTAMRLDITGNDRTLNVMPPFHTGGLNVLMTPFLHHGGYTCLLRKFEAEPVMQLLESERMTLFMGVPTMLKMMVDTPAFASVSLTDLRYFIVGGEAMPVPLIEQWQAKGIPIRQGYGMTEVGPNLMSLHHRDAVRKKGSIGKPNFYVETRVVNEAGADCAANEPGELWIRGPMVTPGYWHNPEATAKAITDGWFHTGDMVRVDEEGYFYVVDRIKNMFISGGENVYPAEVERVLLQHPGVTEVAVTAIPHEKWGEVGKAWLVCEAGVNAEDLQTFCRERLAKFKVPQAWTFVAELPKNATGKIDRKALA